MSHQLTIEPLGQVIEIEEGQTILDAALRAGIYLPHACGHGLCGTCKVQVSDGEIEHGEASGFALMDYEREEGLCLACCATVESDVVVEAEIDEEPDALNLPVQDFHGVVARIEDLTPTIKGVWIELDAPITFQAGQYVNLHIPGEGNTRAFSIASAPAQRNEIELNIRRVPGGMGTAWVHEQLRAGERVKISGPYGRFFLRHSEHQAHDLGYLFLAGGSCNWPSSTPTSATWRPSPTNPRTAAGRARVASSTRRPKRTLPTTSVATRPTCAARH